MTDYLELNKEQNIKMTNLAYDHCSKDLNHEELICELFSDDELKKQVCILNLKSVFSQKEADALVDNLTGKGGPVREVASLKINEFIKSDSSHQFFQTEKIIDTLLQATTDVNPAVCRNIIEIMDKIDNIKYLNQILYQKITATFEELKVFKDYKSHLLNKKTFKLYWSLETLTYLLLSVKKDAIFFQIVKQAAEFNDYTIREKASKIISSLTPVPAEFKSLSEKLKSDENLYVRRFFEQ
ncbi:MAG: hypothetical protein PHV37_03995 [Candidatus Gastranaerophilales bacterium]|nr:hypothetical protein [Candidatus Gastranaerophilales bacterium]